MILNHKIGGSLSKVQLDFYNKEGYLVLPGFLSTIEMQPAIQAMQEKVSRIADGLMADGLIKNKLEELPFHLRLAKLFTGLSDKQFLKYGRGWRDRIPGYFHLMSNPKILDVVESIIGGEIFSNPAYNVRPKVPNVAAGAVPWHQDKSYWPDSIAKPVITVWLSFVDATLENGCLHLKPGSHIEPLREWHEETLTGTGFRSLHDHQVTKWETLPVPVKAGTAIIFNDCFMHSSTSNNSDSVRWSVDLRYQPSNQDPMLNHGVGFLARSYKAPEKVATLEDWMAERLEHQ